MALEHGGDLVSARKLFDGTLLDVSVNLNPMGTPPQVLRATAEAMGRVEEYPDPQCRALRRAIADRDGVTPEQVFCGNGAAEVIFRLALALKPKIALLTAPTFSEYEDALTRVGCQCRFHTLRQENLFDVTGEILEELAPPVELVMLCNPNNPTGRLIPGEVLRKILNRCAQTGAVLAVDECFLPLAAEENGLAGLLQEAPNLFLLRAFTKTYAIPGLRLGYGLGSPALIQRLEAWGPCWNVSVPAQAAGLACCQLPDWPADGRRILEVQRPLLEQGLTLLGCQVIPGSANYLLFRLPGICDLKERLLHRGVLLRSCANYRGLGPDWYRAAVRQPADNEAFLRILRAELEE